MRFFEFKTQKPVKPMTPAQSRIRYLQQNVERQRNALKAERERQRQQREKERQRKQAQQRARGRI